MERCFSRGEEERHTSPKILKLVSAFLKGLVCKLRPDLWTPTLQYIDLTSAIDWQHN